MLYSDWLNIQTQNQVNIHPPKRIGGGEGEGDVNLVPKTNKLTVLGLVCLRVLGNITKPRKKANELHVALKQGAQQLVCWSFPSWINGIKLESKPKRPCSSDFVQRVLKKVPKKIWSDFFAVQTQI